MGAPYRLVPADKSWVRFFLEWCIPYQTFWMTYRLPFQKEARITYPPDTKAPESDPTVQHELHHVRQFAPWYGPLWMALLTMLIPLPILFSGRWFVERGAYFDDIRIKRLTVDDAVEALWSSYAWAWPKPLMRRWFQKKLSAS